MKRIAVIALAALAIVGTQIQAADALTEALQKGLFEEEANRNLDAAIKAYQSVLAQADEQRRVAATAMFRLAECYRKQGKTNEAVVEYRRLLRDYADQTTLATLSRQNLAGLGAATAAGTAAEPAVASTDAEEREIRRIKAMIKDSPDLINARSQGPGGTTALHDAARQGHFLVAEFLLANGADVNARDLYNDQPNYTPLHIAAANGHKRIVELLLAKGAMVNARDSFGRTPLQSATGRGFRAVVEVLLANQADVNARDSSGWTPLHTAISGDHAHIAELLMQKGADLNLVAEARQSHPRVQGAPNPEGTPLHLSVQLVKPRFTRLLLQKGADPNARTPNGLTALHVAAQTTVYYSEFFEIAKLLIDHKAELDTQVSGQNFTGWTPLLFAVNNNATNLVTLLLEKGAKPNLIAPPAPGSGSATAPLQLAVSKQAHVMAKLLLDHGADVNLQDGQPPPLFHAIYNANVPMVELLLRYKPDLKARLPNGDTPLLVAVSRDNIPISEALLKNGANPNDTNDAGVAAIHAALGAQDPGRTPGIPPRRANIPQRIPATGVPAPQATQDDLTARSMLELLLDHKADPNLRHRDGQTPLQLAVHQQKIWAMELLLTRGADPNAPGHDKDGNRALHWAVLGSGSVEAAELLLAHKADPNGTNGHGATPLHYISSRPQTNLLALLVKHGANVNACDNHASTPLHRILSQATLAPNDKYEGVRFLLNHGADVTKTRDGNQSPFDYAMRYNNTEQIIDLLRKHHPKKLAKITFRGPVDAGLWFWDADESKTLSEVFKSVRLYEKANPREIKILRNDPVTALLREMSFDLEAIRAGRAHDAPVQDGDKIVVAER